MVQEWLSSNKNRAYPFVEDSNLGPVPQWMVLDLRLWDSAADSVLELRCTGVRVERPKAYVSFSYGDASFELPVEIGKGISVLMLSPSDTIRVRAAVYGGGAEYVLGLADGTYEADVRVNPANVVSIGRLRKLRSLNGATGRIHLADGYGTTVRIQDGAVVVSVGNGLGLGTYCRGKDDEEDLFDCGLALLFMNGQHADTSGNIDIVGGTGVSVQTGRKALAGGRVVPAITVRASGLDGRTF